MTEYMNECEICPYHFSKYSIKNADIICMPYNYIVSAEIRK